jgi:hypothetical protein
MCEVLRSVQLLVASSTISYSSYISSTEGSLEFSQLFWAILYNFFVSVYQLDVLT